MAKPSVVIFRPAVLFYDLIGRQAHESRKATLDPFEQQLLEEMLAAKKSAAQIGLELDRHAGAVYARIQRWRVKGKSPHEGAVRNLRGADKF
jgi:IS30 family transposase